MSWWKKALGIKSPSKAAEEQAEKAMQAFTGAMVGAAWGMPSMQGAEDAWRFLGAQVGVEVSGLEMFDEQGLVVFKVAPGWKASALSAFEALLKQNMPVSVAYRIEFEDTLGYAAEDDGRSFGELAEEFRAECGKAEEKR